MSNPCTPPDYTVHETRDGRLINRRLGVCYPDRPDHGFYSLAEHNRRKKEKELKTLPAGFGENSEVAKHFRGVQLVSDVEAGLKKEDICLFYLQRDVDSLDEAVQLCLGYKDEAGEFLAYPLTKRNKQWRLEEDNSSASFDALENLVTHYKTFRCIDVSSGRFSLFTVKSQDNIADLQTIFEKNQKPKSS